MTTMSTVKLDAMIEEATVDCHNEDEQATGLFTMLEEHLSLPFETSILGVPVIVRGIELNDGNNVVAICVRDKMSQRVSILDLPLPTPPPAGADWIAAYRRWARHQ